MLSCKRLPQKPFLRLGAGPLVLVLAMQGIMAFPRAIVADKAAAHNPLIPALPTTVRQNARDRAEVPQFPASDTTVTLDKQKFDLAREEELKAFLQKVQDLQETADDQPDQPKAAKTRKEKSKDWSGKHIQRGLKEMERTAKALLKGDAEKAAGIRKIQEVNWAVQSNFRTPYIWRESVDIVSLFFRGRDIMLNACGRGSAKHPAQNLLTYDAPDLSRVDPKPSTFWSRPQSIADKNLYYGFDRQEIPPLRDSICTFAEAHKGYGAHPSFEVDWNGSRWKVKFGEEHSSGPFGCRIFWALGFPAEIIDYTPEVKIKWDRRIFKDFNSRKSNAMKLQFLGLTLTRLSDSVYYNPLDYVKYAVLKDGTRLTPQQLQEGLFPVAPGRKRPKRPETNPALYSQEFEQKLDYLVMKDASFNSKDSEDTKDLGFWDYNYLDHPRLRELRGLGVLNAWLDNWDIRWANNRLLLVKEDDGTTRLEHMVSDVGALFGNSSGMIRTVHGKIKVGLYQNAPNDYCWAFTAKPEPGKTDVPICDYMPITKTRPFYDMNIDDARWMARLIGQLTEEQLKQALIGAGYDAAVCRLLLEKLAARRDKMIQDFGLSGEIPLMRPNGPNKKLTYDPNTDGPFEATLAPGRTVAAQNTGEYVVLNGWLKRRQELKPARQQQ